MIKKTAAFALSFAIFGQTVFAASGFDFYENISDAGDAFFVVDGYADEKNEEVNILILNPGYDLEKADTANGNYIRYAASVTTDENGRFSVNVPIDLVTDLQGEYRCYVGGKAFSANNDDKTYYLANEETIKTALGVLKKALDDGETAADIAKKILQNKDNLSINNALVNGIDAETLAGLILSDKEIIDPEDYMQSVRKIQQKALLAAYNGGKKDLVVKNNEFLYTDFIDFSEIDKNSADIYANGYLKILSVEGKGKVINALFNKNFKTEEEILDAFASEVILKGIKNAATDGNGHIGELLTEANAKVVGLDLTEYLKLTKSSEKSAADTDILNAAFSDIDDLQDVIDDAVKDAKKKQGGGSGGSGGSSSQKGDSISISGIGNEKNEKIEKNEVFSDLSEVGWAKEAIESLYESGIINGVGENMFAPQKNVTREQFLVMIMRAFNMEATAENNYFDDAEEGSYYIKYVNTAKEMEIVNGISENIFGVGKYLSRQDLAVMVKNIAEKQGIVFEEKTEVNFDDEDDVAEYAKEAVNMLARAKFITGFEDNTFRPKNNCTRAQTAKIIYELLKGENKQ